MQQFAAIGFVLALLWAVVCLLRKKGYALANNRPFRRDTAAIEELDKMRMTPQHSLYLLRVESRKLLVAVHPQGVTLLEERGGERLREPLKETGGRT